jgi:hypothetical protein
MKPVQPPPQPAPPPPPEISLTLGADGLVVLGGLAWLIWERMLKPVFVSRLDRAFAPVAEERRLNILLAQIGLLTGATRVILAAFHNGDIDSHGYHLTKISATNSYTAPGHLPMDNPVRDLPISRIQAELDGLLAIDAADWVVVEYSENLPAPCRDHLRRNNIDVMYNRLVRVGTLPIGLLSLQFDPGDTRKPPLKDEPYIQVLETLFEDIASVMRGRVVHPGPLRRTLMRLRNSGSSSPLRP